MLKLIVGLLVAGTLLHGTPGAARAFTAVSQGQQTQTQQGQTQTQQVQTQQGRQGGQRGGRPRPANVAEAEQQLRLVIARRLRDQLRDLPDSVATRLASVSFRYRDSSLVLQDRERFIRNQLGSEGRTDNGRRIPNEARLDCLLNEFFNVVQGRRNVARAEHSEIATFLTPLNRYRYLAFQENLNRTIDDAIDGMSDLRGRGAGGRGRGDGPPLAGGVRQGGPPDARGGRGRGPPPAGRGIPPRFASICPPGPAPAGSGG